MGSGAALHSRTIFWSAGGIGSQSLAESVRPFNALDGNTGAVIMTNEGEGDDRSIGDVADSEDEDLNEHGLVKPKMLPAPNPPSKQERLEHDSPTSRTGPGAPTV